MEPFEDETNNQGTNPLSIAGMVTGIVSLFVNLIGIVGIVAVILSSISLKQIGVRKQKGKGMAIAGLVLGIIGTVFGIFQFMLTIMIFSAM